MTATDDATTARSRDRVDRRRPSDRSIAAGLALLTLGIGVAQAGDESMWMDEAYSAVHASGSFSDLVDLLRDHGGMAGFHVLLWLWSRLGESDAWLRTVPVIGGALAVACTFLYARRLGDRRTAVLAATTLLCHPFFQYYLVELRTYSWLMALSVASAIALEGLLRQPSTTRGVVWGASTGLAIGLVPFSGGFVLIQMMPVIALWRRGHRRPVVIGIATMTGVFLPTVPPLLGNDQISWIPDTTAAYVGEQLHALIGGWWWTATFALGWVALAISVVLRRRSSMADGAALRLLAAALAVPTALLVVSLATPVFLYRYMAPTVPLLAVTLAVAVVRVVDLGTARRPGLQHTWLIAVVLVLALLRTWPLDARPRPVDLRHAGGDLTGLVRPGDVVVFDSDLLADAIRRYWTPPRGTTMGLGAPGAGQPCPAWYVAQVVDGSGELVAALDAAGTSTASRRGIGIWWVDRCG